MTEEVRKPPAYPFPFNHQEIAAADPEQRVVQERAIRSFREDFLTKESKYHAEQAALANAKLRAVRKALRNPPVRGNAA